MSYIQNVEEQASGEIAAVICCHLIGVQVYGVSVTYQSFK